MSMTKKEQRGSLAGPSLPNGLELIQINPEGNAKDVFGFQLSGNRTMGVYIRNILGGSNIDKTGQLQVGDQLIQIDDMPLAGMTTDQVARVLRLSLDMHGFTKLTVAHRCARSKGHAWRPISPLSTSFSDSNLAQEVASKTRRDSHIHHKAEVHDLSAGGGRDQNPPSNESDGPRGIPKSTTHDALMTISEGEDEEAVSPAGDTETSILPEGIIYKLRVTFLKPIQDEATMDQKNQKRAGGKTITPVSVSASMSQKKKAKPSSPIGCLPLSPKGKREVDANSAEGIFLDTPQAHRKLSSPPLGAENFKDFLSSAQRKSFTNKDKLSTEEVPLVCFDQLNRSYTDICAADNTLIKRTNSGESSKSSSASNRSNKSSNGSQHLAWQCPVCFDGANRINKTKRRLMSTACGHVFCSRCVADIVRQHKICPTCRKTVKTGEVHPIFM